MAAAHTTGRTRHETAGRLLPAGRWRVLPDRGLHQSLDPGGNGAGRPLLHLHGKLDRRELGIRARPPVEWIVGRDVLPDVELALERMSGEPPVGEAGQA